jgi:hypothetical protein
VQIALTFLVFLCVAVAGCSSVKNAAKTMTSWFSGTQPSPQPAASASAAEPPGPTTGTATRPMAEAAPTHIPLVVPLPAGTSASGAVTDPKAVQAGSGQVTVGLDGITGEVTGQMAAGSRFTNIRIGMTVQQVLALLGTPTDQGAFIHPLAPFPRLLGSDAYRYELLYKGQGRLIFTSPTGFDAAARLVWIVHSSLETGYR